MTTSISYGSGFRVDSEDDERRHRAFLGAVGRVRGCIDTHHSLRVRDIVHLDGRPMVVAADAFGEIQPVTATERDRILAACARFGPISFSNDVADCLAIPAGLGLPCDPSIAPRDLAEQIGGAMWNHELRELATIHRDADWTASAGLDARSVEALNVAVHDFFETAFSHDLVVRVG